MPITADDVATWARFAAPNEGPELDLLELTVDAVIEHIAEHYRVPDDVEEWTPTQRLAALMQSASLWRRRDTPDGAAQFGDGAVYVTGLDRDVSKLLTPRFGIA